jgi:hypothetical protein
MYSLLSYDLYDSRDLQYARGKHLSALHYTRGRLTRFKSRGVVTLYGELSTDMDTVHHLAFRVRGLAPCSPPVSLNLNRPDSGSQSRQLWVMFKPPERAAPGRLGHNRCAAIGLKGSDSSLGGLYT